MIIAGPASGKPGQEALYVTFAGSPDGEAKVVRSTDGGRTFEPSVAIHGNAYGDLALSSRGVLHMVDVVTTSEPRKADRFGDVRNAVEYRRSEDGAASFTEPVLVSEPGVPVPYFFSNAQIIVDEDRKALYVVYPAGTPDGRWNIVLSTSRDGGATWHRVRVNDDVPCANHMTPSAALDARSGRVHVIWVENRAGRGGVAYASCESGGARCAPNESISDEPFASYGFVRHSPRWLGEYGSLIIDAKRRVMHAVWTQTVETPRGAKGRIAYARATLR
jgi:hypothetical protein